MTSPADITPTGPSCAACGEPAIVQWRRRLTDTELAAHIALEQERRDQRRLLADPQLPPPDFGPLPQTGECTTPVFACRPHAIGMDAAALIHEAHCGAPFVGRTGALMYGCDCTPEPHPKDPEPEPEAPPLPDHWR